MDKHQIRELYRKVLLVRQSETAICDDYFSDEMKTPVHLGIGAEAISVGVHHCLDKKDRCFGTYRNHSIYLACSEDTDGFFGEMYGKMTGCAKGKAGSMHMSCPEHGLVATSAVVTTTVPVAVGSALAQQLQGLKEKSVVFLGDGATEEGAFYESLNFASLKKLPVLFVIENNDLAIHSHRKNRQGTKSFKDLTHAFDCEFDEANGVDAAEVALLTQKMLAKMKSSGKPGVLVFHYHRFLEHVGPNEDYKFGYREKPSKARDEIDPVAVLKKRALAAGLTESELAEVEITNRAKIEKSVKAAKQAPFAPPEELYTDVMVGE